MWPCLSLTLKGKVSTKILIAFSVIIFILFLVWKLSVSVFPYNSHKNFVIISEENWLEFVENFQYLWKFSNSNEDFHDFNYKKFSNNVDVVSVSFYTLILFKIFLENFSNILFTFLRFASSSLVLKMTWRYFPSQSRFLFVRLSLYLYLVLSQTTSIRVSTHHFTSWCFSCHKTKPQTLF